MLEANDDLTDEPAEFPEEEISYPGVVKLDLQSCLLAALHGQPRRTATLRELREKLSGVGKKASPAVISLTLVDLQTTLDEDPVSPFKLVESGTEWSLVPKHEALEVLAGNRRIQTDSPLSETELMVLSLICFEDGVTRNRIEKRLLVNPDNALERLARENLIYDIPGKTYTYWRPTRDVLKKFGIRRLSEIPGYSEYQEFLRGRRDRAKVVERAEKELEKAKKKGLWSPGEPVAEQEIGTGSERDVSLAPVKKTRPKAPKKTKKAASGTPAESLTA